MNTRNQTYQITDEAKARLRQFSEDVNEGNFKHEICAHHHDGSVMYYSVNTDNHMACAFVSCVGLIPLYIERITSNLINEKISYNEKESFYHAKDKQSGVLYRKDITTPAQRAIESLRDKLDNMRVAA